MSELRKSDVESLNVVKSAADDNELGFLTEKQAERLVEHGLVEQNPKMMQNSKMATRLTPKGVEYFKTDEGNNKMSETNNEETATHNVSVDTDVPMPESVRAGGRPSNYNFDALTEVGHSLHIPAESEEEQKTIKGKLGSVMSNARRKYGRETGEMKETPKGNTVPVFERVRDFKAEAVGSDDPRGMGVRIFRTM